MEEIWSENGEGESLPESVLPLHCCSWLSSSQTGAKVCGRHFHPYHDIRRHAQPPPCAGRRRDGVDDLRRGQHAGCGLHFQFRHEPDFRACASPIPPPRKSRRPQRRHCADDLRIRAVPHHHPGPHQQPQPAPTGLERHPVQLPVHGGIQQFRRHHCSDGCTSATHDTLQSHPSPAAAASFGAT